MAFQDRLNRAQEAMDIFELWCAKNSVEYAHSGHESLKQTNGFKDRLYKVSNSSTSLIRYFPDYTTVSNTSALIEVKYGKSIQREAYNIYMKLNELTPVYIVFCKDNTLHIVKIDKLVFSIPRLSLPIEDDVWVCPRQLDRTAYMHWKSQNKYASGTDYAYIDFDNTPFKELN
jgi:hypothetical protein